MAWANVSIPAGVIRQATPYDAANRWWDTSNVRWVSGAICPIGGNNRISTDIMPSKVRKLFQWRDNVNNLWLAVGHENGVRVQYGGDFDVTPAGFIGIGSVGGSGYGVGPYDDPSPISDPAGTTFVKSSVVTITIASPGVVTWPQHNMTSDDVIKFTTTGALPSGLASNTAYYVKPINANTFQLCTIAGGKNGTSIDTTGSQSGVHTATQYVGQDTYGRQRSYSAPQFRKPDFWTFASFGQDLLGCCSSDGRLLHMSPTTGQPVTMDVPSNAPIGNIAVMVTSERSVVLLGAGGNKRRVAWSDFEDYNGWTFNTTGGEAGYIDIEATAPIVSGIRVKEGILILTQHEAFLMRYVGAPYFYGIEKLGATTFAAPNTLAVGGNLAVWFGDETFWTYDGSAVKPLQCPFFADLKQDFDPVYGSYRAHMHENGVFPEFWMDYPSPAQVDGECNQYLIWNYVEGWWARGNRSVSAMCGANTGKFPVGAKTDQYLYQFEDGWTEAGLSRVGTIWAETSLLDVGSGAKIIDINQAMVPVNPTYGSQNYQLKFYSRFAGDQPELENGPYLPRSDGYTDMRCSARDLRMRVEATNDNYWSLGPVRLDIAARSGER